MLQIILVISLLDSGFDKPVRYFDQIHGKVVQNGQSLGFVGEILMNNYQHS
jgi:hypothetical protein